MVQKTKWLLYARDVSAHSDGFSSSECKVFKKTNRQKKKKTVIPLPASSWSNMLIKFSSSFVSPSLAAV